MAGGLVPLAIPTFEARHGKRDLKLGPETGDHLIRYSVGWSPGRCVEAVRSWTRLSRILSAPTSGY